MRAGMRSKMIFMWWNAHIVFYGEIGHIFELISVNIYFNMAWAYRIVYKGYDVHTILESLLRINDVALLHTIHISFEQCM